MASLTRSGSFRITRARYRRAMSVEGSMGSNLAYTAATAPPPSGGGGGGPPIITLVDSGVRGGQNTIVSPALNTTGANLLVVFVAWASTGTAGGISDNKGNLWQAGTQFGQPNGVTIRMFYCIDGNVGNNHTITWTGTQTFAGIIAYAFKWTVRVASIDQFNLADVENGIATNVDTTSFQTGSILPTAGGLMFTFVGWDTNTVLPTVNEGFVNVTIFQYATNSNNRGITAAWQLNKTGLTNPTWLATSNSWKNHAGYIVNFR